MADRGTVPGVERCLALMAEQGMLANIRQHSLLVAEVAGLLADELAGRGEPLSPALAVAGGLLHDIAKTACLASGHDHAEQGRRICLAHGYPAVAEIVAEHVLLARFSLAAPCTEKEIVYYADKRVLHAGVVGLSERLADILVRYGNNDPRRERLIRENFATCLQVETKLFARLDFAPAELPRRLNGRILEMLPGRQPDRSLCQAGSGNRRPGRGRK